LTATLLMLALVSAFAPFASLASALSHAKMPCCEMASHHAEGGAECVGHSCHTKPAQPAAKKPAAKKNESKQSDPMCGTDASLPAKSKQAAHDSKHTQHAATAHDEDAGDDSSHSPASHDSAQSPDAQTAAPSHSHDPAAHGSALSAAVSKPCPPDCSTGANSVTNRTSRREHAAATATHTPRATARRISTGRASRPSYLSAEQRRQTRPRAPPSSPVS
jgi:hypothetical protein